MLSAGEYCCASCLSGNVAARGLYDSYEFIKVNIRKGYYNDNGEDAIVMCKALGGNLV